MPPDEALLKRTLAAGEGWSLHEIVCRAGPSDRPFEERHDGFSVSAVIGGNFTYRSDAGHGLLYPGALLLGNNGSCFECGHAHGIGDRCISLNVREEQFSEIAAAATLDQPVSLFGPEPAAVAESAADHCADGGAVLRPVFAALRGTGVADHRARHRRDDQRSTALAAAPTGRETRRVIEAIRLVESDAARPLELKDMAAVAGMSKYHFLRVFRRLTGMTPHRYLISARLRRAALALTSSRRPVIAVALDAGFGDLSTFNKTFRAVFGLTPTQYRDLRR